jgi:D-alanyl-D-alanine carboxypeptidase
VIGVTFVLAASWIAGTISAQSRSAAESFPPASVSAMPPRSTLTVEAGALNPGDVPGGDGRATSIDGRTRLTKADGVLPDGVTAFDADLPGIQRLDSDLLQALRDATRAAARDGIELSITSGWRSRAYQEALLRQAIAEYGSRTQAVRWVATAETSPHVSGDAVDVGPSTAVAWLARRGAHYGLCRIYRNEPWHFELRVEAIAAGCPAMYADPAQDPRMRG